MELAGRIGQPRPTCPTGPGPGGLAAAGRCHGQRHTRRRGKRAAGNTGRGSSGVATHPTTTQQRSPRYLGGGGSYDPATSQRLVAESTPTKDMYLNQGGSRTAIVHQTPVNYVDRSGKATPIDTRLVAAKDPQWWQPAASGLDTNFAARSGGPLVRWALDAQHSFGFSLLDSTAVAGKVGGDTVSYPEVQPGVTLTLTSTTTGVKESLVLASPRVPTQWRYRLALKGLTAVLTGGAVVLTDERGVVRSRIPAGYLHDSAVNPRSGEFAESGGVTYALSTVNGAQVLTVSIDKAWLGDPARRFPVVVDPTNSIGNDYDTFVKQDESYDHGTNSSLKVGTWDTSQNVQSVTNLRFAGFGGTYGGMTISSVKLHIFDSWAWSCTAFPFSVNRITESWGPGNHTNYPGPTWNTTALGSVTAAPGAACTNTAANRSVGTWMTVPLSASTFQQWASGTLSNFGLAVTASSTDEHGWKIFTSTDGPGNLGPYLEVTYANPNVLAQIDSVSPSYGAISPTLTPELVVRAHDPDSTHALNYRFSVYDGSTLVVDSGSTSLTLPSWTVPSGALTWGKDYRWQVIIHDGTG